MTSIKTETGLISLLQMYTHCKGKNNRNKMHSERAKSWETLCFIRRGKKRKRGGEGGGGGGEEKEKEIKGKKEAERKEKSDNFPPKYKGNT